MDGVINVNKPKEMTSFDVVAILKKILNTKKVGHTGTLDPDATGVLPICIGKATKLVEYLTSDRKKYKAAVQLGITTDTQDISGNVIKSCFPCVSENELKAAISSFIGEIEQIPPMYSAVKIDGKKLYELAREGRTVERKPRQITIHKIDFLVYNEKSSVFEMEVDCSKGTYIRTLANDIGEKLGCGAVISELERLSSGNFNIGESYTLEEIKKKVEKEDYSFLIPLSEVMNEYGKIILAEKNSQRLQHGIPFNVAGLKIGENYRVFDESGAFLAIARCGENRMEILKTFFG